MDNFLMFLVSNNMSSNVIEVLVLGGTFMASQSILFEKELFLIYSIEAL